jgi:hypothetical protein
VYVSEVFDSVQVVSGSDLTTPFLQFIQQKYGYKTNSNNPVSCFQYDNTVDANIQKPIIEGDWKKELKVDVVETGWKWVYKPGAHVTPPISH